ncbi:hypothetical protein HNR42_000503 [Deinobacterium chartae]|uniref:Uncharacterized protein n=1 Tax=Deinobacterium chartae TaxID=521158 RepID=A0A841HXY6_9DEIO|nr:hypothetical protein [Deinobacterium chartae]MBB6097089.1 hypothetical protein [Deinobacterium chartae]
MKPGNSFEKLRGKGYANDHEATINMFTQKYKDDFILSNTIDGINSLEWLKKRREQINYLQLKFLDPNPPYFMKELAKLSPSDLYHMIQEFYKEDVYIFDKDHAILALPIRQISRTFSELKVARIEMDYGKEIVDHLSRILSDDAIISLIKQKSLQ